MGLVGSCCMLMHLVRCCWTLFILVGSCCVFSGVVGCFMIFKKCFFGHCCVLRVLLMDRIAYFDGCPPSPHLARHTARGGDSLIYRCRTLPCPTVAASSKGRNVVCCCCLILRRMGKNKTYAPTLQRIRYISCVVLTRRSRCNSSSSSR